MSILSSPRIAFALVLLASTSSAENSLFYGSVRGGVAFPSSAISAYQRDVGQGGVDTGYEVGVSAGIELSEFIRWDVLDYSYYGGITGVETSTDPQAADLSVAFNGSVHSLTTSFRFGDFRPSRHFHYYVSVGIGAGQTDLTVYDQTTSEWGVNASVGLGFEYAINKTLSAGLRYRFRYIGFEPEFAPRPEPFELRMAEVNLQMHTIAVEFLFH